MQCPLCEDKMQERLHEQVHVDLCGGCGACWLDAGELAAQPGAPEGLEDGLRARLDRAPMAGVSCPRCAGGLRSLEVPQGHIQPCPSCGGLLLDSATTLAIAGLAPAVVAGGTGDAGLELGGEVAELGAELALEVGATMLPDALDGAHLLAGAGEPTLPDALDGAALLNAQDPLLDGAVDGAALLDGANEGLAEGFFDGSAAMDLGDAGVDGLAEGADSLAEGADALWDLGGGALELAGEVVSGAAELAGAVVSGTVELLGALLD